ncbi:MAG: 2-oxo acid dehydrogenase subunit E2 [Chloroflexi bacterium]|nr:MAG: 2-oxo acid dehydrogenase subunit E2 [Chloroflexota bacterium]
MATEIKLPDLGVGIEDVTIVRWLVHEGDAVEAGATLVEVATDKVDTEVAAPVSGSLLKRNFSDGEIVDVSAVLGLIGAAEETAAGETTAESAPPPQAAPAKTTPAAVKATVAEAADESVKATPVARRVAQEAGVSLDTVTGSGSGGQITKDDVLSHVAQGKRDETPTPALPEAEAAHISQPVRRLAATYNVDLRAMAGEKALAEITRHDVLRFVAQRDGLDHLPSEPDYPAESPAPKAAPAAAPPPASVPAARPSAPPAPFMDSDVLVPHTRIRQIIAKNMVQSAFSAPHVTTLWDVNMAAVIAHRTAYKKEFAAAGVNLTITAYLVQAIVAGLKAVPAANASWSDEGVIIRRSYNVGMAVALPPDEYGLGGLIVPVIHNADDLNLQGLARRVNELAEKARANKLAPQDLQGGTFTLTNYGTGGSIFQTPVILQPQVGILGVGAIEKRPVVVSQGHPLEANTGDYLTFAPMTTLGFSYDHRVLDGASADAFCAAVKKALEGWK